MPPPDPYIIFGLAQPNAVVTIQNTTKSTSDTVTANSSGQYIYDDIQASPILAASGDTIIVSVPWGSSSTFVAGAPEEKEINLNYIIVVATGGAVVSGSALISVASSSVGVGGAVVSGAAMLSVVMSAAVSSGAIVGGSSTWSLTIVTASSGGAITGGTAALLLTRAAAGSGGAVAGGAGIYSVVVKMSFSALNWENSITKVTVTPESTDSSGNFVAETTTETAIKGHISDISTEELQYLDPGTFQLGDRKIALNIGFCLVVGDRLKITELSGEVTEWLVKMKQYTSILLTKYVGVSRETFLLKRRT